MRFRFLNLCLPLVSATLLAAVTAHADLLYVADYSDDKILKLPTSGFAPSVYSTTSFAGPTGVAFNKAGNLYVSINGSNQIDTTSGGSSSKYLGTGLSGPEGLAFDANGNLYVANGGASDILKITPGGVRTVFASNGLNAPTGLAFDRAGDLFVSNVGDDTIEEISPDGNSSTQFASLPAGSRPVGLAFDAVGNLYVANAASSEIIRLTPDGTGSVFASDFSTGADGLAFDSSGFLYVSLNNNTIRRYSPSGAGTQFATVTSPQFIAVTDDSGRPLLSVPEPCSLVYMVIGFVVMFRWRRRVSLPER